MEQIRRTGVRSLLAVTVAAALALVAAGCGGGGGTPTTTSGTSATVQWASGFCSSLTTWKTSLQSIKLGIHPTRTELQQAGSEAKAATDTLMQSLRQLGVPSTADTEAAKKDLAALKSVLSSDVKKLQDTLKPTPPNAAAALGQISEVTAALSRMASNLKGAVAKLKQFDPSGELEQAFQQAKSCQPLFG